MAQDSRAAFLVFTAALGFGAYLFSDGTVHRQAPPFSLPETYGGRVDLESYRGRPVLLVFWMNSCSVCRSELPVVNRLAPEYRRRGIAVAAIHVGAADEARDYLRANQMNFTSLVDSDGAVARAYGVTGVPRMVLINGDGRIERASTGMAGEQVLRRWLASVTGS